MSRHIRFLRTTPLLLALSLFSACGNSNVSDGQDAVTALPDTLRVGTLYSPTSYFILQDMEMGYDYELITRFTEDKNIYLDLVVAPNLEALVTMIDSAEIDIAAFDIPVTTEYKSHVVHAGPEKVTTQVLVQPQTKNRITDVTQLVGKEIYVENNSKYYHRLINLNDELGGGILIHTIDRDTLITEDFIDMVSKREIPLTVVDSDIARINRTYYPGLDISLPVSFPQRSSWGIRPDIKWLADSINDWLAETEIKDAQNDLMKRYFEISKSYPGGGYRFTNGNISDYDTLFRKYAAEIGMDWRLLAAQGYAESQFDPTLVSWAGARGIMQIMPSTARAFGLDDSEIATPEPNIRTAAHIMASIDRSMQKYVADPEERMKFNLAAYNAGVGHIYDAIALARKYGRNPQIWDGQVSVTLRMKDRPEYYNDSVCHFGYFRGRQTTAYVNKVIAFYNKSKKYVNP